eukprot:m.172584 g.172584  ORF g.172584 m.172584 type:complete len:742 (-) comp17300_c3_seq2:507-2732(-)
MLVPRLWLMVKFPIQRQLLLLMLLLVLLLMLLVLLLMLLVMLLLLIIMLRHMMLLLLLLRLKRAREMLNSVLRPVKSVLLLLLLLWQRQMPQMQPQASAVHVAAAAAAAAKKQESRKSAIMPSSKRVSEIGRRVSDVGGARQSAASVASPAAPAAAAAPSSAAAGNANANANANAAAAAAARKASKCVQEVQRMADKREARRQAQQDRRGDMAARGLTNNPNVDFIDMIEEFREGMEFRHLAKDGPVKENRITVCVRKRPLNGKELASADPDVITMPDGEVTLVHEPKVKVDLTKFLENHNFRFDYSFDETTANATVYHYTAAPLVKTIFDQGMATCFAYGQTGSGKTHTMGGEFSGGVQNAAKGIYALATADVFNLIKLPEHKAKNLCVSVSFFEIYGGKVFDLLNEQKRLRVLEDAKSMVQIVGLSEKVVTNLAEVLALLDAGNRVRASGTTSANQNSSRSHAVFQIILRTAKKKLHGKFSLIDLAGNERGADTANSDRQTRMEGAEINKSLLALKECIRALGRNKAHTPFRASKLTQVLRDSFVGSNARTCMIAMISPSRSSCEHSLNTLRYADRVKELGPARPKDAGDAAPEFDEEDEEENDDKSDDGKMNLGASMADADLKRLHQSLRSRGDVGDDGEIFQFHQAATQVVELEELVVEEHRALVQAEREMLKEDDALLNKVDQVDNDMDGYVQRLDDVLDRKLKALMDLKERVHDFKQLLKQEEATSKQVKQLRYI